jgi:Poly (ADP-ribose) glycohydrolase (PARG)
MLHYEQDKFYKTILPQIVSVAQFVTTGPQSNLLARFNAKNHKLTLTRFEVASLLANAFLCTLPLNGELDINFSG